MEYFRTLFNKIIADAVQLREAVASRGLSVYLQRGATAGWSAFDAFNDKYLSASKSLAKLLAELKSKGYITIVNVPTADMQFEFYLDEAGVEEKIMNSVMQNKSSGEKLRTTHKLPNEYMSGEMTTYVDAYKPKRIGQFEGDALEVKGKKFVTVRYIDKETEEEMRRRIETKETLGYWVWRRAKNDWIWQPAK